MITRRVYSEQPPRHEYVLTEAGKDLRPVIMALKHWGDTHVAARAPARRCWSTAAATCSSRGWPARPVARSSPTRATSPASTPDYSCSRDSSRRSGISHISATIT